MVKYQEIFNIINKIYQAIYLAQIYYQTHCLIKLKTLPLCSKSLFSVYICSKLFNIIVNHYLISKLLYHKTCVISKTLAINKIITTNQIPGHSNITKNSCINHISNSLYIDINLYMDIILHTDFNMHIKTNTSLVIINKLLIQSLLFNNTQKNSHNLLSCTKTRTNLMG